MTEQINTELAKRSFRGFTETLRDQPSLSAVTAKFTKQYADAATRRRRNVVLDMEDESDAQFWQVLHNTSSKFKVLSEKESHQKGEYLCRVIFEEIGDDLPVYKTKDQLIEENL